jgi:hypothetical protein
MPIPLSLTMVAAGLLGAAEPPAADADADAEAEAAPEPEGDGDGPGSDAT